MAISFLAPTATCSLTATGTADAKGYVWFGLVAPADGAACAAFYAGSTTADRHLWTLAASQGTVVGPAGPFQTADCAVYVAVTGTRASALVSTASY